MVQASAFTSGIRILVAAATRFNWLIAVAGLPEMTEAWFDGNFSKFRAFLLIVNLLLSPILLPTAINYVINPEHFSVVAVFNCAIGMITPPLGGAVFVTAIFARRPFLAVVRHLWQPWAVMRGCCC